ncbi:alpha/beta hydrolase family protein [Halomonas sp. B23F22_10]|uniref:alpha/beta hydrolase family protein n=1 Tax=Halomonas sp. B23F22_10 TaxID=3459515 RepID=UPI00373F174E
MALFNYFPNYVWNLSVAIAMESGAKLGDIMDMCQPLLEASTEGEDVGTQEFMREWVRKADQLVSLANEDTARNHGFSASDKLHRASLYYLIAERMQTQGSRDRLETFLKGRKAFDEGARLGSLNVTRHEIPYGDKHIAVLLSHAQGVEGPAPAVVFLNGLDSCKELLWWSRLPEELARRGISCLCVDQPGTGESLRLQDLPATWQAEQWGTPVYEWLADQPGIDPDRIGITGISLGGYYAPRVCAMEPRFASGAVWGANHNWAEVQHKRLQREGENPVPHYWNHVQWVFGTNDRDEFLRRAEGMTLNGVMERIKVPFLVTHGAKDRQISLDYAHQSYEQLTNSPRRELKIFTEREGGVEHVGADNMNFGRHYIADWFAKTLGGKTA